ncbi:hypothetical protein [Halovenus salina]|uniref:Regulator of chromosome condensation (RCC1) repeat-containing protein n=1 Tax=Halovenus salina TaxID=1510225 RepID=A0ABD5VZ16_9EURY
MNDSDYHEIETVTVGEQWAVAADSNRVAFGRGDGDVILIGTDGRETVSSRGQSPTSTSAGTSLSSRRRK